MKAHFTRFSAIAVFAASCLVTSGAEATPPTSGDTCISCDEVTISCDDSGFSLGPDCVLHVPKSVCDATGLSSGDSLDSDGISGLQDTLSDFLESELSAGQAHDICVTAHELVHATHATRSQGGTLIASASEVGAYDKENACLEKAKMNAASEEDEKLIERQQKHTTAWRDYNNCLLGMHPNGWLDGGSSAGDADWDAICKACAKRSGVDGVYVKIYCDANTPGNALLLCGGGSGGNGEPGTTTEIDNEPAQFEALMEYFFNSQGI